MRHADDHRQNYRFPPGSPFSLVTDERESWGEPHWYDAPLWILCAVIFGLLAIPCLVFDWIMTPVRLSDSEHATDER